MFSGRRFAARLVVRLKSWALRQSARLRLRILTTRYFFDPMASDYQPLPWIGLHEAVRGEATIARWKTIDAHISSNVHSLKDLGCCVGYFCHAFASERGGFALGIDQNEEFLEVANFVRREAGLDSSETFLTLALNPTSVAMLPQTDVTLVLSIWHHWVRQFGLTLATEMLARVWQSTGQVLFFESGEWEVAEEFQLPFASNAREWLATYLADSLVGGSVELVGEFRAGDYSHYRQDSENLRGLFKVTRPQ